MTRALLLFAVACFFLPSPFFRPFFCFSPFSFALLPVAHLMLVSLESVSMYGLMGAGMVERVAERNGGLFFFVSHI